MTAQIDTDNHCLDLGVGQPDPSLLPARLFTNLQLRSGDLAYGKEAGDDDFRQALAQWLSDDYQQPVTAASLLVTNGSSNALDMICTHFSKAGDTVLVEDPTYFLALRQFAGHGLKVVPVPMDSGGVIPSALEHCIDQHQPAFFYTIPSFHNPTGITQTETRRRELVALAEEKNLLVAADEVYQSLYFDDAPPPPLACYNREGPVLSIGSFSKILAPGLRLGWIQARPSLLDRFTRSGLLLSGGGLAPVTSALATALVANGEMGQYLDMLKQTYRSRRNSLLEGLEKHCASHLEYSVPGGGFFLWARLQNRDDASLPLKKAEAGIRYLPGKFFSSTPQQQAYMRLCFAYYDEPRLLEACRRLGKIL